MGNGETLELPRNCVEQDNIRFFIAPGLIVGLLPVDVGRLPSSLLGPAPPARNGPGTAAPAPAPKVATGPTGDDGLCPTLKTPPADAGPNDPATVCDCTEKYLAHLLEEAAGIRARNSDVVTRSPDFMTQGITNFGLAYSRLESLTQSDGSNAGWHRRCALLAEKPPEPEAPRRPSATGPPAQLGRDFRAFAEQQNAYRAAAQRFRDWQLAVGPVKPVAYETLMTAVALVWELERHAALGQNWAIQDEFRLAVGQLAFKLRAVTFDAMKSFSLVPDEPERPSWWRLEMGSSLAAENAACKDHDAALNDEIAATAQKLRALYPPVKAFRDRLLNDLRLWATFAARDGFPDASPQQDPTKIGFLGVQSDLAARHAMVEPEIGFNLRWANYGEGTPIPPKGPSAITKWIYKGLPFWNNFGTDQGGLDLYLKDHVDCRRWSLQVPADFDVAIAAPEGWRFYHGGDPAIQGALDALPSRGGVLAPVIPDSGMFHSSGNLVIVGLRIDDATPAKPDDPKIAFRLVEWLSRQPDVEGTDRYSELSSVSKGFPALLEARFPTPPKEDSFQVKLGSGKTVEVKRVKEDPALYRSDLIVFGRETP